MTIAEVWSRDMPAQTSIGGQHGATSGTNIIQPDYVVGDWCAVLDPAISGDDEDDREGIVWIGENLLLHTVCFPRELPVRPTVPLDDPAIASCARSVADLIQLERRALEEFAGLVVERSNCAEAIQEIPGIFMDGVRIRLVKRVIEDDSSTIVHRYIYRLCIALFDGRNKILCFLDRLARQIKRRFGLLSDATEVLPPVYNKIRNKGSMVENPIDLSRKDNEFCNNAAVRQVRNMQAWVRHMADIGAISHVTAELFTKGGKRRGQVQKIDWLMEIIFNDDGCLWRLDCAPVHSTAPRNNCTNSLAPGR